MTPIETVARAICNEDRRGTKQSECKEACDYCKLDVRKVIETLRKEMTKQMVIAGEDAYEDALDSSWDSGPDGDQHNDYTFMTPGGIGKIFQAMLDEALEQGN